MAIAVLVVVAALFLLPIELPYSIEVPGKLLPLREWVLIRGQDGRLISTLYDHLLGTIEGYEAMHVDRGDHVTFKLHPAMEDGKSVAAGDTGSTCTLRSASSGVATMSADLIHDGLAFLQERVREVGAYG